jgi:hypothetical protein
MPRILNIFRSKGGVAHEKKSVAKKANTTSRSSSNKGGVFRRNNESSTAPSNKNGDFFASTKFEIKRSTAPVPIEQTLTWTMTDETASPVNAAEDDQVPLLHEEEEEEEELLEQTVEVVEQPVKEEPAVKTFTFTEEDLKRNELNHMSALAKLKKEIGTLLKANKLLSTKHAAEMAKKNDDGVELLIQIREKEDELAMVRAELEDTKQELKYVSCKLMQTQHEQFEENSKNQWMSVFGCSFATF